MTTWVEIKRSLVSQESVDPHKKLLLKVDFMEEIHFNFKFWLKIFWD